MFERLQDLFNDVYLAVYGREYSFVNKNVEKLIKGFLTKTPKGIGDDWLFRFIVFQFAYYDGMKTRFERIYLNWIFGEKALKRWSERTEAQMFYANQFKQRLGLRMQFTKLSSDDYRTRERMRFTDPQRRLLHCDELALFDNNSKICIDCPFFLKCKVYAL